MNGEQYARFKEQSAAMNTQGAGTTAYPLTEEERANLAAGVSTDWQDLLYKPGFNTSHQLGLQGGVENILDTQYRVFASGIHGPGRNVFIALRIHL